MDIKEVKEEIKKEEELLVRVFQLEKFLKKYKKPLIVVISVIILILIGNSVYSYYKTNQLIKANNALESAMAGDKKALEELKSDKKLYDLYLLQKGDISKISTPALEEIKAYEMAMKSGDKKALEAYLNNPNYHVLKNAVRVALIRIYLKENNHQKAVLLANEIPPTSKFKEIAMFLIHYGIVK
jgi:predicted negative regulator of RcsB-dependent stress response